MSTAASIHTHPANIRAVNLSCRSNTENSIPNTASVVRRTDATFGFIRFWHTICKRNPAIVLKIPRYNIFPAIPGSNTCIGNGICPARMQSQEMRFAKKNCRAVSTTGSVFLVYLSTNIICKARPAPHMTVRKSPVWTVKSPRMDKRPMPKIAMKAAATHFDMIPLK